MNKTSLSEALPHRQKYSGIPTRRRLKIAGVEERTGVHRQTIWRWYTAGFFPQPHYLGQERLWFEDEIENWEQVQMARRAAEKASTAV